MHHTSEHLPSLFKHHAYCNQHLQLAALPVTHAPTAVATAWERSYAALHQLHAAVLQALARAEKLTSRASKQVKKKQQVAALKTLY